VDTPPTSTSIPEELQELFDTQTIPTGNELDMETLMDLEKLFISPSEGIPQASGFQQTRGFVNSKRKREHHTPAAANTEWDSNNPPSINRKERDSRSMRRRIDSTSESIVDAHSAPDLTREFSELMPGGRAFSLSDQDKMLSFFEGLAGSEAIPIESRMSRKNYRLEAPIDSADDFWYF